MENMSIIYEERASESPYVEAVIRGRTVGNGSTIRPAALNWHMVFARDHGRQYTFLVGPWRMSGAVTFTEGVEILWIRFRLGTFLHHFPTRDLVDTEIMLPGATSSTFWLKSSARQFPDYGNAEAFADRLAREETLVRDPVVDAALQGRLPETPARTLRHHFLRATGLTQSHIRQMERAQRAAALLQQGVPILETVFDAGYFDQPHMTRSLKQFIGYTPAQLIGTSQPA